MPIPKPGHHKNLIPQQGNDNNSNQNAQVNKIVKKRRYILPKFDEPESSSDSSEHDHHCSGHDHHCSGHDHHEKHNCEHDHKEDNCKNDCLCQFLEEYRHDEVTITTKTGEMIIGELQQIKGCCLKIAESGGMSPFLSKRLTFIRCQDIESFSVDLFN